MEHNHTILAVLVDDDKMYTLVEVCQKLNISEDLLMEFEELGLFSASPQAQQFINNRTLSRIETAYRIHNDLEVNVAGAVLALELLDQLEELKQQLALLERPL